MWRKTTSRVNRGNAGDYRKRLLEIAEKGRNGAQKKKRGKEGKPEEKGKL